LETDIDKVLHFNRAMLCKARIMLPQDIFCSSVTIRCCIKTAEHIVILSALGSPIILDFCEPNRFPQCADHPGTTRSREHKAERAQVVVNGLFIVLYCFTVSMIIWSDDVILGFVFT